MLLTLISATKQQKKTRQLLSTTLTQYVFNINPHNSRNYQMSNTRQHTPEETKVEGGVAPIQQIAAMSREEWVQGDMAINGNGGRFIDDGTITVGLCSKCPDVGPIGYKCRKDGCSEVYKMVVGINNNMRAVWIDGKLFAPLIGRWSINIPPDNVLTLQQQYTRQDIRWWYWCPPVMWKNTVSKTVATRIFNGELKTIRQVLYTLEREWRIEFNKLTDLDVQAKKNASKHLQRVIWDLHQMDYRLPRQGHHLPRQGHQLQAHARQEQITMTNRPQTRSQDKKKRARIG